MTILVVAIIFIVLIIWGLFGLWGARTYDRELDPELKAISDAVIENRKEFIIEDGRRLHSEWQKKHRFLGSIYQYKPTKYFRNNQLNRKRYPY